ncbi:MAG: hypothetical protein E3J64_08020 [Anaerolineales bacterium]|nr:MAG: hypothetical protein E3J64_08020 [Anaerolineales bacterium]
MSAGSGAAAVAVIAQAIKASGAIVNLDPEGLQEIIRRQDRPLIVFAVSRFPRMRYKYLTSYKGLAFYAESRQPLALSPLCEIVEAKRIWIPG